MKLLAVDTATEACSAALLLDEKLSERFDVRPREHTRLILPMVEALLAEAGLRLQDLDALAFGRGPGAFTGLRIAAGVVQGLALGADLPVVPVSNLAALARAALRERGEHRVLACLDARMGEVYWGAFSATGEGLVQPAGPETVCAPGAVPVPEEAGWAGAGPGWGVHTAALQQRLGGRVGRIHPELLPRAGDIATLAAAIYARTGGVSVEQALPVYLRDEVAWKKRPA